MKNSFKVGDKVNWRGAWGKHPVKKATLEGIEVIENVGDKYGTPVESTSYETARERKVIFSLVSDEGSGNTHWAYPENVAPLGNDPRDWHKEE